MENHNLQRAVEGHNCWRKVPAVSTFWYLRDVCCCRHMALEIGEIKIEVMGVPGFHDKVVSL